MQLIVEVSVIKRHPILHERLKRIARLIACAWIFPL